MIVERDGHARRQRLVSRVRIGGAQVHLPVIAEDRDAVDFHAGDVGATGVLHDVEGCAGHGIRDIDGELNVLVLGVVRGNVQAQAIVRELRLQAKLRRVDLLRSVGLELAEAEGPPVEAADLETRRVGEVAEHGVVEGVLQPDAIVVVPALRFAVRGTEVDTELRRKRRDGVVLLVVRVAQPGDQAERIGDVIGPLRIERVAPVLCIRSW